MVIKLTNRCSHLLERESVYAYAVQLAFFLSAALISLTALLSTEEELDCSKKRWVPD